MSNSTRKWKDPVKSKSNAEFKGGFIMLRREELILLLNAVRDKKINKNGLRVYFAIKEKHRIKRRKKLNELINVSENTRLTNKQIFCSVRKIRKVIVSVARSCKKDQLGVTKFPSRLLRYCLSGKANVGLICFLLMYFYRRKPQRKRMKNLPQGARYARFTYRNLQKESGLCLDTINRTVIEVIDKKLITRIETLKNSNIRKFGACYIDGKVLLPKNRNTQRGDIQKRNQNAHTGEYEQRNQNSILEKSELIGEKIVSQGLKNQNAIKHIDRTIDKTNNSSDIESFNEKARKLGLTSRQENGRIIIDKI